MRALFCISLVAGLSACAQRDAATCESFGFELGTVEYYNCVQNEEAKRREGIRRANENFQNLSKPECQTIRMSNGQWGTIC